MLYLVNRIFYYLFHLLVLCEDGDLRLVDGDTEYEGRVEICIGEVWGTICDDFWGTLDAEVVCQQLGYNSSGQSLKVDSFSPL